MIVLSRADARTATTNAACNSSTRRSAIVRSVATWGSSQREARRAPRLRLGPDGPSHSRVLLGGWLAQSAMRRTLLLGPDLGKGRAGTIPAPRGEGKGRQRPARPVRLRRSSLRPSRHSDTPARPNSLRLEPVGDLGLAE